MHNILKFMLKSFPCYCYRTTLYIGKTHERSVPYTWRTDTSNKTAVWIPTPLVRCFNKSEGQRRNGLGLYEWISSQCTSLLHGTRTAVCKTAAYINLTQNLFHKITDLKENLEGNVFGEMNKMIWSAGYEIQWSIEIFRMHKNI